MLKSHRAINWSGNLKAITIFTAALAALGVLLASLSLTPRDLTSTATIEMPMVDASASARNTTSGTLVGSALAQDAEDAVIRRLRIQAGEPF